MAAQRKDKLRKRLKEIEETKKGGNRQLEERTSVFEKLKSENDLEACYQAGWHDLNRNRFLGRAPAGLAFLMPLTVGLVRETSGSRLHDRKPKYQSLTVAEREAVKVLHTCLTGATEDVNQILHTTQAGKLFEAMYILFRASEDFWNFKTAKSEGAIYDRVKANRAKPKRLVDRQNFQGLGMALEAARHIVEVITEEGKAPSVSESDATRAEIESAKPFLLKRASRLDCDDWSSARSWFGGRPRLGRLDWPRSKSSGEPMLFLTQIDLSRIQDLSGSALLPRQGWLAFFMDRSGQEGTVRQIEETSLPDVTPVPEDHPVDIEWLSARFRTSRLYFRTVGLLPYFPATIEELGVGYHATDEERDNALSAQGRLREYFLSASQVIEKANAPAEFFGHSLSIFAANLQEAAKDKNLVVSRLQKNASPEELETLKETARKFEGICKEVSNWAESVARWHKLSAAETDRLKAFFVQVKGGDLRQFCRWPVPVRLDKLLTQTYLDMLSANDWVFSKLPLPVRTVLAEDFTLPTRGYCHQLFGRGISVQSNAACEHAGDHMLLQLTYDDVMGWEFGDLGVFQFWISPENLKLRNWSAVELSFECN